MVTYTHVMKVLTAYKNFSFVFDGYLTYFYENCVSVLLHVHVRMVAKFSHNLNLVSPTTLTRFVLCVPKKPRFEIAFDILNWRS